MKAKIEAVEPEMKKQLEEKEMYVTEEDKGKWGDPNGF